MKSYVRVVTNSHQWPSKRILSFQNQDAFMMHLMYALHAMSKIKYFEFENKSASGRYLSGTWFNIKMSSYHYRNSHCGDKTIWKSSYLHNRISYTGKNDICISNQGSGSGTLLHVYWVCLPELSGLVQHKCQLVVVLHDELHDVGLVPFEGQPHALDLDDDIEQVQELRGVLLVLRRQVDDRLNLLWKDLQASRLVADEGLQG